MEFHKDVMKIDAGKTAEEIAAVIKRQVRQDLKRAGVVVGISGGIDSSVVVALCAKALGPENVLGIMLPEKESAPDSRNLAQELADQIGIKTIVNNISPSLEGFGCYDMRDEAIRRVFPEYGKGYNVKITIASKPLEKASLNFFNVVIEDPDGNIKSKRLPRNEYLQIVAASNLKQRSRMTHLYYHAERLNYAVAGTGQKDEHELGFFVKYGDGGADFKPIAHLFKLQVFQLAEALPVPKEIISRTPTTDTYSSEVDQTEFFYGSPFEVLDPCWYALENNIPADEVAKVLKLSTEQVERVFKDIQQKIRGTNYLRSEPLHFNQ
ncbi:MAG: NAD(+) synthase [candidate division Zixibacteria bacterium]|nr:NAD(+) synthase [candidate division Zixibacteria bacterium]